jgi:hypothetical protein
LTGVVAIAALRRRRGRDLLASALRG